MFGYVIHDIAILVWLLLSEFSSPKLKNVPPQVHVGKGH